MVTENTGNREPSERITQVAISDEMRSSYLDYAMSVVVSRALPDVRDGLKPVQRRILYAMNDQGMRPGSGYKKSARLVGEVLGKYHPHSDTSIYDAMVRMVQPFAMNHPLIDGQGNFGSMDGDMPAAMRYTECRMATISTTMLNGIDRDTVNWRDNFDQTVKEPVLLPSELPNLLLNGASGIAVGLATNIPPHNLGELCDAIEYIAKNPDAGLDELMEIIKGPDFPTGGEIIGVNGIRDAYRTGRGRIVIEAKYAVEAMDKTESRQRIVISELPYQVNKAKLVSEIAALINKKRLEGASTVRDESDRKGLRIVVELKRGGNSGVVINNLLRYTKLRTSYSFNVIALVSGTPQLLTLKQTLVHFVEFRREIIRRRTQFELKQARARIHILEGLLVAINNLDDVIQMIRDSEDVTVAKQNLANGYGLSDMQAQAVLDMQLRRLAALEREKINTEHDELLEKIADLKEILSNPARVTAEVIRETTELGQRFARPRLTAIKEQELTEWRREDVEPQKEVVITLSKNGYIKRMDSGTYKSQHRGGKGVRAQSMSKEDDYTSTIQVANTHDTLLIFTSKGRVLAIRVFELPTDQSRNSRGSLVQNIVDKLQTGETVTQILVVESLMEDTYLVMTTRQGRIKRFPLALLRNIKRSGLICLHVLQGDELAVVNLAFKEQGLVMVSRKGMAIRFPSETILPRSRRSGARRGMKLNAGDEIVATCVVDDLSDLLIVTEKGYGKISAIDNYRVQQPGGKGLRTIKVTDKNGPISSAASIDSTKKGEMDGRLFLLTRRAQILRTNPAEMRRTGRVTQGVILAKPNGDDLISSIQLIEKRERVGRQLSDLEAEQIDRAAEQSDENGAAGEEGIMSESGVIAEGAAPSENGVNGVSGAGDLSAEGGLAADGDLLGADAADADEVDATDVTPTESADLTDAGGPDATENNAGGGLLGGGAEDARPTESADLTDATDGAGADSGLTGGADADDDGVGPIESGADFTPPGAADLTDATDAGADTDADSDAEDDTDAGADSGGGGAEDEPNG